MKCQKLLCLGMAASLACASLPQATAYAGKQAVETLTQAVSPEIGRIGQRSVTENGIGYSQLEDGTLEITSYTGASAELMIPAEIDGAKVTAIGEYAFELCEELKKVELPEGITEIGRRAFSDCCRLETINLPKSLKSIGRLAFSGCTSLNNLEVPESVVNTANQTFQGCLGLTSVKLLGNPEAIGAGMFQNCTSLTEIEIPKSVKTLENSVFSGCSNLRELSLPDNLETIGNDVFSECRNLSAIKLPGSVQVIGERAFKDCETLDAIDIPAGVSNIGYGMFSGCSKLKSATLPQAITSIGHDAFYRCASLEEIVIPSKVEIIDINAFYGCASLGRVTIPETLTDIGSCAFANCSKLTDITVAENNPVYQSEQGALYDKEAKTLLCYPGGKTGNVTIPLGVVKVEDYAFSGCASIKSVELPESVTEIGNSVFSGCSGVTSVTLPKGLTQMGQRMFESCKNLKTINLPESIAHVSSAVFQGSGLQELTVAEANLDYAAQDGILYDKNGSTLVCCPDGKAGMITIPSNVSKIGEEAFFGCANITSVVFPENLEEISYQAFSGCAGLQEPNLPANVVSIDRGAFAACESLTEISVNENNNAYASKDGILYNKDITALICCPAGIAATVQLPDSVRSIGDFAFQGCSQLKKVAIPKGVSDISFYAFEDCGSLMMIVERNSVAEDYAKQKEYKYSYAGECSHDNYVSEVTRAPSCTVYGVKTFTCAECQNSYTEEIAAPGHAIVLEAEVPAACTQEGKREGIHCSGCRLIISGFEPIAAVGHNYQKKVVQADAKKNGSVSEQCTRCKDQRKKTVIYAAKTIKLSQNSLTYNKKVQKPSVTVKDSKGKALKAQSDYTVSYPKGMKNVGSYEVVVKFKGNYKGKVIKSFTIAPKTTSIVKLTPKNKGFTVKWNKQPDQVTGYEIAYSTEGKFSKKQTKIVSVAKNQTVSKSISKLKANKKYYVRMRTYQAVKQKGSSAKIYSQWSKAKSVTTKK